MRKEMQSKMPFFDLVEDTIYYFKFETERICKLNAKQVYKFTSAFLVYFFEKFLPFCTKYQLVNIYKQYNISNKFILFIYNINYTKEFS